MAWTEFWDMHSGGQTKVKKYDKIYIEAPKDEAEIVFYNRFHRRPHHVTCSCCGEDYAVRQFSSLGEATEYHRNYDNMSVGEYIEEDHVLVIYEDDIDESDMRYSD